MKNLIKNLANLPGWRTNRKIVVIESDDWGTIRMSSKEAFNSLLKKGYPVDQCPYNKYDALESNQDLEMLFDVLNSVKGNALLCGIILLLMDINILKKQYCFDKKFYF